MRSRAMRGAKIEGADLAVEAERGARNERHAMRDAGRVDGVAGGEVVGAIEYDGRVRDVGVEPGGVGAHGDSVHLTRG